MFVLPAENPLYTVIVVQCYATKHIVYVTVSVRKPSLMAHLLLREKPI